MLFVLYLFACSITMAFAIDKPFYDLNEVEEIFENFIKTYNKTYSYQFEKQERFEIFKHNIKKINELNSNNGAVFELNKYSDLTKEEFKAQRTGFKVNYEEVSNCDIITDMNTSDAPDTLSWVDKGAVTPVKDQQACGSCWTFSTTGNIEGQYFLKYNQLKSFSEQQLVDCSKRNKGCGGGTMSEAMLDIMEMGGLELETTYPYTGDDSGKCTFDKTKTAAQLSGCKMYQLKNEGLVKDLLAKNGPLSIAICGEPLNSYKKGILTFSCGEQELDHAVLLVGYGTENGVDYWTVKNSWGSDFGENGYFRMKRDENTCGFMYDYLYTAVVA